MTIVIDELPAHPHCPIIKQARHFFLPDVFDPEMMRNSMECAYVRTEDPFVRMNDVKIPA